MQTIEHTVGSTPRTIRGHHARPDEVGKCGFVRLLEADPELGWALNREQWAAAANAAVAPVFSHARGRWQFAPPVDPASLGTLVLEGLIAVSVNACGRSHLELLGQGDLISPWVGIGSDLAPPTVVSASVISPLRLAFLGRGFAMRIARWPELHASIVHRLITRSRRLSLQSAINGIPRIEERLELTLWQLAYRFGKVTSNGLKLQLGLTHTQLAEIVAARRPSVTVALARLEREQRLVRSAGGAWLLAGGEPHHLLPLTQQVGLSS